MLMKIFLLTATLASSTAWYAIPQPNIPALQVSAKGQELWMVSEAEQLYRWSGSQWDLKHSQVTCVGASPDGYAWMVDNAQNVYRYNAITKQFDQIPGLLTQVNAISRDKAIGVNHLGDVFLWNGTAWNKIGEHALWAAIGEEDEIWVVSADHSFWRRDKKAKGLDGWVKQPGTGVQLDVQSPLRVVSRTEEGDMAVWEVAMWNQWTGKASSITVNETSVYAVEQGQVIEVEVRQGATKRRI